MDVIDLTLVMFFILFIAGLYLNIKACLRARKITNKKLGYGPTSRVVWFETPFRRYFSKHRTFYWPIKYYNIRYELKDKYKAKVDRWERQFTNDVRCPLLYLGTILLLLSVLCIFVYIFIGIPLHITRI